MPVHAMMDRGRMPFVTVAIPVFNTAPYLRKCIDSVLSQTMPDLEVICIDDASTDGSADILDEFAKRDSRVTVLRNSENQRQGYCRNLALKQATGTYIYFLDSDDFIAPHALETLAGLAQSQPLDAIFFDAQTIYETDELQRSHEMRGDVRAGSYPAYAVSGPELFDLFVEQDEWLVYIQREFWRTEHLRQNEIRFLEGIRHDDELFSHEALAAAKRALYLPEQLLYRRVRTNSLTTSHSPATDFAGYARVFREMSLHMQRAGYKLPRRAEDNLMHIYELARIRLAMLSDSQCQELFEDPDARADFEFLMNAAAAKERFAKMLQAALEPLAPYESIAIYGAGKVGFALFTKLVEIGIRTSRFVVTARGHNPEKLRGIPVITMDEYVAAEGEALVVAMGAAAQIEVSRELARRGVPHFLYGSNHVAGPF